MTRDLTMEELTETKLLTQTLFYIVRTKELQGLKRIEKYCQRRLNDINSFLEPVKPEPIKETAPA